MKMHNWENEISKAINGCPKILHEQIRILTFSASKERPLIQQIFREYVGMEHPLPMPYNNKDRKELGIAASKMGINYI